MSNIILSPSTEVRQALQKAFPRSNTERALKKYIEVLQQQINAAILNGRTAEEHKLGLYSVSLHELTHKGSQIGPRKVRLHKWLGDNGLAMVVSATTGSNLSGRLSQVRLTDRVTIEQADTDDDTTQTAEQPVIEQVETFYPGLSRHLNEKDDWFRDYDVSPVALDSLSHYIRWLRSAQCQLSKREQERELAQARRVFQAARLCGGIFLQKKKPSVFGRTYYQGVSVQSVSKTLRRAMLGQCWEYDMRSCVVAWKLGFAKACCEHDDDSRALDDAFPASFSYLFDKARLIGDVCDRVFDADSRDGADRQVKLVKQALTAISFGAREKASGWLGQDGKQQISALASIFSNANERQRFIACPSVRAFIDEQKRLDNHITQTALDDKPSLRSYKPLLTQSGRLSKPKLMAYLYQNAEARVMSLISECLLASGYKIIARIHDALIISDPMPESFSEHLMTVVRVVTQNDYWHLSVTAHEPFKDEP